jgi:phage gpG-like protein
VIQALVKYTDHRERVAKAMRAAAYRRVDKAAFAIRKTASDSIVKGEALPSGGKKQSRKRARIAPSKPGMPPHTRFNQLKKAIVYVSKRGEAVIGPRKSVVGLSASAHEFGGTFKGEEYPARPFMGPALLSNVGLFGGSFKGSLGG